MDAISREVYFESLKTVPTSSRGTSRQTGNSYTGQRAYCVHRDLQRACCELKRSYDRRWRIAVAELDRRIAVYENRLRVLRRRNCHQDKVESLPAIGEGQGHGQQHSSRFAMTSHQQRRDDVTRLPNIGTQFRRSSSEGDDQLQLRTGADVKQRKVIFLTADLLHQRLNGGAKTEASDYEDW